MCKTIAVDGEGKGVRGGKCGKPTSNSLSFSITKSVATKHPVDVTSPHIAAAAGQCYSYIIAADRTDGQFAICDERGGRVWEVEGGADARVGASPSSPRSSLCHHAAAPARQRLKGTCQEPEHGRTDWRATQYVAALADRRRSTGLHTKTTLWQYYEQFCAVTK